ncbi:MAG: site-specific DNA-methyltransferase [Firmicutes bacterium]|nr:site-specific DNA-methyltransferase [Bacillota bacterium]
MKDILFRLPEIYRAAEERYNEIKETGGGDVFRTVETFAGGGENCLVRGDNLRYMAELLRSGYAGKIDMIYADPPFFSKSDYTINVKVGKQKGKLTLARNHAFTDRWKDGMAEYLENIALAMMLMKDLLSETGTIFVHLDWHSSHYLKVILDQVFGEKNFINEIVWTYKSGGASKRTFARKHDVLLFYAKSKGYYFQVQEEKSYNRDLKPYRFKGVREYRDEIGWYTLVSMKDVWQIDMVGRTSSERTGYATQKPEALLKRILDSVTREGDLCADFYCGSGTLGAVCEKTGRRYLLCDNSAPAVMTAHKRLVQLGSPHELTEEEGAGDDNLHVQVSLDKMEGVLDNTVISLTGLNYGDPEALGIDEKNLALLDTVVEYHYDELIEYWCIDPDYDGRTVRPKLWRCRDKKGIDIAMNLPSKQLKNPAVKVIDVFGNEYIYTKT